MTADDTHDSLLARTQLYTSINCGQSSSQLWDGNSTIGYSIFCFFMAGWSFKSEICRSL